MNKRRMVSWSLFVMLCLALGCMPRSSTAARASQSMMQASSLENAVHKAGAIVVGTLTRQEARYGDTFNRFIFTDQTFTVEVSLIPESGLQANKTVRLTSWGGTIGDETQELAEMPTFTVGERYILLLRPEWSTISGVPFVDMDEGVFRVVTDATTKATKVFDVSGAPVNLQPEGNGLQRADTEQGASQTTGMTLEAFVARLRQELPRIQQTSVQQPEQVASNDPRALPTYERPDDPSAPIDTAKGTSMEVAAPQAVAQLSAPAQADIQAVGSGIAQPRRALEVDQGRIQPAFATDGYADLPIVINQLPASYTPWSPEDQLQMVSWNHYASDVFRVYATPTGRWAFHNGVFDLAGWPSSDTMKRQFGSTWADLNDALGVTFTRKSGNKIIEADVALNPAYSWTLDDEALYNGSTLRSFRRTMAHELGHVWGLQHQFNFLSIMNYSPNLYRGFPLPFMDDAEGIRQRYPSHAVDTTDLGIELFYSAGYQNWQQATFPASVAAGNSFSVNNYQLENVGTQAVATPTVEWYLTTTRNFNSAYYYLGSTSYPTLNRFFYFTPSTVARSLAVPTYIPTGSYYLAAYIRGDQSATTNGFQVENSRSFSRTQMYVFH